MEIEKDSRVQLYFMNNSDSEYLSVYGKAFIYDDKSTIERKMECFLLTLGLMEKMINVSILRIAQKMFIIGILKLVNSFSLLSFATAIVTGNKTDNSDGVGRDKFQSRNTIYISKSAIYCGHFTIQLTFPVIIYFFKSGILLFLKIGVKSSKLRKCRQNNLIFRD